MITVYSKPNCMQCEMTKRYMQDEGIEFSVVDIEQDETAVKMLMLHGYQGLPVVAVDGFDNYWSGFRPDRIDELVEKRYHDARYEVAE